MHHFVMPMLKNTLARVGDAISAFEYVSLPRCQIRQKKSFVSTDPLWQFRPF
jgi:hypothetical protein